MPPTAAETRFSIRNARFPTSESILLRRNYRLPLVECIFFASQILSANVRNAVRRLSYCCPPSDSLSSSRAFLLLLVDTLFPRPAYSCPQLRKHPLRAKRAVIDLKQHHPLHVHASAIIRPRWWHCVCISLCNVAALLSAAYVGNFRMSKNAVQIYALIVKKANFRSSFLLILGIKSTFCCNALQKIALIPIDFLFF